MASLDSTLNQFKSFLTCAEGINQLPNLFVAGEGPFIFTDAEIRGEHIIISYAYLRVSADTPTLMLHANLIRHLTFDGSYIRGRDDDNRDFVISLRPAVTEHEKSMISDSIEQLLIDEEEFERLDKGFGYSCDNANEDE